MTTRRRRRRKLNEPAGELVGRSPASQQANQPANPRPDHRLDLASHTPRQPLGVASLTHNGFNVGERVSQLRRASGC